MELGAKLSAPDAARIERQLGARVSGARACVGGYSSALRLCVQLDGGETVFAKIATSDETATWLRAEQRLYSALRAGFLAETRGWDDDGARPILLLEDLGPGNRPPPWAPGQVERVRATLAEVAATPAPPGVPALTEMASELDGWSRVAAAPAEFLALRLVSSHWLERAIDTLVAAEASAELAGDELVHLDVRSDNLSLFDDRVVLFDWSFAHRGNAALDVAFWLPSLHAEGGPPPEALAPDDPSLAAVVSGFFAWDAGRPPFPNGGERVRAVQLSQLESALPWAARALGLPAPDGPRA